MRANAAPARDQRRHSHASRPRAAAPRRRLRIRRRPMRIAGRNVDSFLRGVDASGRGGSLLRTRCGPGARARDRPDGRRTLATRPIHSGFSEVSVDRLRVEAVASERRARPPSLRRRSPRRAASQCGRRAIGHHRIVPESPAGGGLVIVEADDLGSALVASPAVPRGRPCRRPAPAITTRPATSPASSAMNRAAPACSRPTRRGTISSALSAAIAA